jgi:2-hydroxy-6-oxonona-2,4-dienedioate hydrolase
VTTTELTRESTSRTLTTPDGELHYHEAGDGPPLLLVHGSGPGVTGWANFGDNLPRFAAHFRTIVIDLPGFGVSHPVDTNPVIAAPGALLTLLDGLGIASAAVVGNSLGGGIAAGVAANHPERVHRLVTLGGVGVSFFSALPPEGIIRLVEFAAEPSREALQRWMRSMVFDPSVLTDELIESRWTMANDPEVLESLRSIYNLALLDVFRSLMLDNPETLGMLRRITAPTLLTWGRDDRVTPLDAAIAPMRIIPRCELHVFPDCGHWAMLERKDEWESVVLSFLLRDVGHLDDGPGR